jgi:hypothetical protein
LNNIQAWLERLTAASGEFNKAKVGKLAFIGNVYLDVRPEIARNGQTIRIPFPDTGAWSDIRYSSMSRSVSGQGTPCCSLTSSRCRRQRI